MDDAIEILDRAYDYNESRIREHMRRAKGVIEELDKITEEIQELNKKQIEINEARKALRKAAKDK